MNAKETRLYVRRGGRRGMLRAHRCDDGWLFEVGGLVWSLAVPHNVVRGMSLVSEECVRAIVRKHGGCVGESFLEWFDSEVGPSLRGEGRTGIMTIPDLGDVRYVILDGVVNGAAKDIAVLLGAANPSETVRKHCTRFRYGEFDVRKGRRSIKVIDEEEAINLVLSSGKKRPLVRKRLLEGGRLFPGVL